MSANDSLVGLAAFLSIVALALTLVTVDIVIPRKRVIWISSIYFGLLIGLLLTASLGYALVPLLPPSGDSQFQYNLMVVIGISLCYLCTSFLVQTRDDFRFIIPYVEFRREIKGLHPLILDTSVIIDGRIAGVLETLFLDNQLVVPRFVIEELQYIADSADRNRRTRGRRGLDILNRLQKMQRIEIRIDDTDLPEFQKYPVDLKLVELAKHIEGRLVTNDYNLNKVAKVHNVDVINLNELANTLKPIVLPGERLSVEILKQGEEITQGIGYLDDGTMVVVEGGQNYIGEKIVLTVTSVLQTSAGKMLFGRFEHVKKNDEAAEELPSAEPDAGRIRNSKSEKNRRN
ncbi:MAG: TRAM domain-containing protein [Planctomycetaceae bacterium]|nr:TRAM domain-containing protein [Planctomycetaceae bacterium]